MHYLFHKNLLIRIYTIFPNIHSIMQASFGQTNYARA